MKKKIAIPIIASIFFLAFVILSVYTYSISTASNTNEVNANGNRNEIRFYGCTNNELTKSMHCDPLMNKVIGILFPSNQSLIYTNFGIQYLWRKKVV